MDEGRYRRLGKGERAGDGGWGTFAANGINPRLIDVTVGADDTTGGLVVRHAGLGFRSEGLDFCGGDLFVGAGCAGGHCWRSFNLRCRFLVLKGEIFVRFGVGELRN